MQFLACKSTWEILALLNDKKRFLENRFFVGKK